MMYIIIVHVLVFSMVGSTHEVNSIIAKDLAIKNVSVNLKNLSINVLMILT